jgi:hypothetical protein
VLLRFVPVDNNMTNLAAEHFLLSLSSCFRLTQLLLDGNQIDYAHHNNLVKVEKINQTRYRRSGKQEQPARLRMLLKEKAKFTSVRASVDEGECYWFDCHVERVSLVPLPHCSLSRQ